LALFGLSRLIHATDLTRALAMLVRAGWPLGLVLLPTLAAMTVDAWGWRAVLATLGQRVRWLGMLELRLSVEALVLALPGGSVAGEAAKVALLRRRAGVPLTVGAASLALTKLQLIASDAAYLVLIAAALRWAGWGTTSLPQRLTLAGAAFTGAVALGLGLLLHRSRIAGRIAAALARLPSRRLRDWLGAQQPRFAELDRVARAHAARTPGLLRAVPARMDHRRHGDAPHRALPGRSPRRRREPRARRNRIAAARRGGCRARRPGRAGRRPGDVARPMWRFRSNCDGGRVHLRQKDKGSFLDCHRTVVLGC
jgi:hypothetical protein